MMDDSLISYLESMLPEKHPFFIEMEHFAKEHRVPIMEATGIEAMLQIMKIQSPKRILEIGTAIGYSALRMATALPQSHIVTIEIDPDRVSQALNNISKFGLEKRITLLQGNALDLFEEAKQHGPFDAIFIDAAKGQYSKFFELYEKLLTAQGCIYSDNVLFKGLVVEKTISNKRLSSLVEKINMYNNWLINHENFETVIIPVGDGLAISRRT